MKHSAALKVKPNDLLALNARKDGVLYEVISISFPEFTVQECGTTSKPKTITFPLFFKPTNAQLNAHNKRKERLL